MFPIAAIEISDVITIVATLATVTGALATTIAIMFWSRLNSLDKRVAELTKAQGDDIKAVNAQVSAAQLSFDNKIAALDVRNTQRHDTTTERVFERIETNEKLAAVNDREVRRDISDVSVTVAGFPGAYIPRREFEDSKREG